MIRMPQKPSHSISSPEEIYAHKWTQKEVDTKNSRQLQFKSAFCVHFVDHFQWPCL